MAWCWQKTPTYKTTGQDTALGNKPKYLPSIRHCKGFNNSRRESGTFFNKMVLGKHDMHMWKKEIGMNEDGSQNHITWDYMILAE